MTTRWWTEQTGDTEISATPSPHVFLTTTNTWVGSTALISSWNPMRYLAIHWSGTRRWPFILHSCPCSTASSTIKRMVIEKHSLDFNGSHCSSFVWKWKWCWHWHRQRGEHCEAYWASLCLANFWNRLETKIEIYSATLNAVDSDFKMNVEVSKV